MSVCLASLRFEDGHAPEETGTTSMDWTVLGKAETVCRDREDCWRSRCGHGEWLRG